MWRIFGRKPVTSGKRIACVTTCRGRLEHLRSTLPKNLRAAADNTVFIILDYNDQDHLGDYIRRAYAPEIKSGRLVYYQNRDATRFHMAHAKNQAHRCAMREGAEILVTLDADNLIGRGFIEFINNQFQDDPELSYLSPDFLALPPKGQRYNRDDPLKLGRGFAGRLAIRTQDFLKMGGYNEVFDTWRGEDIDLLARLKRLGFKKRAIDAQFLRAVPHSAAMRFLEYPEARKYEDDDMFEIAERAYDTVVNYGKIGCGTVYRNFKNTPIQIDPLPTRVFGIGMQRTGTTSLYEAFRSFGFDSGHWESADWARSIWREMNKWGHSRVLEQKYALTDNPIPVLYDRLDKAYPGSKFILTIRDEAAWIKSMEKLWSYDDNPQRWVWDTDQFSHKMHGIIYGTTEFNREVFLERYRRHNEEVIRYFDGREDFMCLAVKDNTGMTELARFLGQPETWAKFPHSNSLLGGR